MSTNYQIPEIKVHDPLAAYLGGPDEVEYFSISLLDAGRLSGHLCPSVAGAFLATAAAVKKLFPEDEVCQRGLLTVDIPGSPTDGAYGPIASVISYITGAWADNGFGGIQGQYRRRNLLHFNSDRLEEGHFRFERIDTGKVIEVSYFPQRVTTTPQPGSSFGENWQERVKAIVSSDNVIKIHEIES